MQVIETDPGLQFDWDGEREKFQKKPRAEGAYLLLAQWTERILHKSPIKPG